MTLLKLNEICKSYSGNQVLQGVSLELNPGEIHGLVGENGAGKSTLMNVLFGMDVIHSTGGYEGSMYIDGDPYDPKNPMEAMDSGIGMVHQEFMLIPGFTVVENIKLNRENTKATFVSKVFGKTLEVLDTKQMNADAEKALSKLNLDIDSSLKVAGMPVGYMQFVEIAREIDKSNLKVLILDEPTAVLTESESDQFLDLVKKLSNLGIAILFITHRLDEIKSITDNITILRDGKLVKSIATKDISVVEIAEFMVGRGLESKSSNTRPYDPNWESALKIEDLYVNMPGEAIRGIDLDVKKGEILGIGGLAGQGKLGLANGIMGLYPSTGKIYKDGVQLPLNNPRRMLNEGITFLSEDRKEVGLLLDEPIDFNIAYTSIEIKEDFIKKVGPLKLVSKKEIRKHSLQMIDRLDIRCKDPSQHTRYLSGGNQQKVCIARALTFEPEILLVSEPTRGIDVGAKKLVLDTLLVLNKKHNMTIIISSSELAELKQISNRIAIITEGKIQTILAADADDKLFGLAMSGEDIEEVASDGSN